MIRLPAPHPIKTRRVCKNRKPHNQNGFALIITIVLLAMLVLLMVSMAALTRVETAIATNYQTQDRARQNALLALKIALGQMQKYAGPDQRVTATADLAARDATGDVYTAASGNPTNATSLNGLATPGPGTRYWTGVWGNPDSASASYSATPTPVLLNWLVSGNETVTLATASDGSITAPSAAPTSLPTGGTFIKPSSLSGLTTTTKPTEVLSNAGKDYVMLVGPKTAGTTDSVLRSNSQVSPLVTGSTNMVTGTLVTGDTTLAPTNRYVAAPLVNIAAPAGSVPGLGATATPTIGRYAWWVGDEGVKAKVNLRDTYAATDVNVFKSTTNSTYYKARQRYAAVCRSGAELIAGLSAYPANASDLDKVICGQQFTFAAPAIPLESLRTAYPDITAYGFGVIADSLRGGLRQDLNYNFAKTMSLTGPLIAEASPFSVPVAVPTYGPTWARVKSYYDISNINVSGADDVSPRVATKDVAGIVPTLIKSRLLLTTKIDATGKVYLQGNVMVALAKMYANRGMSFYSSNKDAFTVRYRKPATPTGSLNMNLAMRRNSSASKVVEQTIDVSTLLDKITFQFGDNTNGTYGSTRYTGAQHYATYGGNATFWCTDPMTLPSTGGTIRLGLQPFSFPCNTTSSYAAPSPGVVGTGTVATGGYKDTDFTSVPILFTIDTGLTVAKAAGASPTFDMVNAYLTETGNPTFDFEITPLAAPTTPWVKLWGSEFVGTPGLGTGDFIWKIGEAWCPSNGTGVIAASSNPAAITSVNNPVGNNSAAGVYSIYQWAPLDSSLGGETVGYQIYTDVNMRASSYRAGGTISLGSSPQSAFGYVGGYTAGTTLGTFANMANTNGGNGLKNQTGNSAGMLVSEMPFYKLASAVDDVPIINLAQLRHADLTGDDVDASVGHQPMFALTNSYFNPFLDRDKTVQDRSPIRSGAAVSRYYDISYLLNTALYDRYYCSSAFAGANVASFSLGTPAGATEFPNHRLKLVADITPTSASDLQNDDKSAARYQMINGAFNINSTSPAAWAAFLSGANSVGFFWGGPPGTLPDTNTPDYNGVSFPRSLADGEYFSNLVGGGPSDAYSRSRTPATSYDSHRKLKPTEIVQLSEDIVREVRNRGPFVSLAHFINRALDANTDKGKSGALQTAIDKTRPIGGSPVYSASINYTPTAGNAPTLSFTGAGLYATPQNLTYKNGETNYLKGQKGWLLQGDILQSLGNAMAARSDTFTIRTYGDVQDPLNPGVTKSRAWCEAVVQRFPDFVDPTNSPDTATGSLTTINKNLGRRFRIVSFRWLGPDDI